MGNEITKKETSFTTEWQSSIQKQQVTYLKSIEATFVKNQLQCDEEQKTCVLMELNKINDLCMSSGITIKDLNQDSLISVLQCVAMFRLNPQAKECYTIIRNKLVDKNNNTWIKNLEFGVEGSGNDKILRLFGVDLKKIKWEIVVHENDEFTYPYFDGTKMNLPTWKPKSYTGKIKLVCYIIEKNDGTLIPIIAERESVANAVIGQIKQNLMQFRKDWGASYDAKCQDILNKASAMDLETLIGDKDMQQYISPTYLSVSSREAMIERKLRNSICKLYPKDFKYAFVEKGFDKLANDSVGDTEVKDTIEAENDTTEQKEKDTFKAIATLTEDGVEADEETGEIKEKAEEDTNNKEKKNDESVDLPF